MYAYVGSRTTRERHARGEFELIFPTVRSLEALQRFATADEVVKHAASIARITWLSSPNTDKVTKLVDRPKARPIAIRSQPSPSGRPRSTPRC